MIGWNLPVTVTVGGQLFAIRSDFRAVLDALAALQAPDLTEQERRVAFCRILYPRWRELPDYREAFTQAAAFVNLGQPVKDHPTQRPWQIGARMPS